MTEARPTQKGSAIEIQGLRKWFGEVAALDGLDLTVQAGTVFGLLGPNGAGKTTLVRIFATLLEPDDGWVAVLGHDVFREPLAVRGRIGLAGQFAADVDGELTGRENVEMIARLYRLPGRRHADARASCSSGSGCSTPRTATSRPTRAGCAVGSTSRPG